MRKHHLKPEHELRGKKREQQLGQDLQLERESGDGQEDGRRLGWDGRQPQQEARVQGQRQTREGRLLEEMWSERWLERNPREEKRRKQLDDRQ